MSEVIVWSGWIGGFFIGLYAVAQYWLTDRQLGCSAAYGNACGLASNDEVFRTGELSTDNHWRLWFLAGLPLGGAVGVLSSPGSHFQFTLSMGSWYDQVLPTALWAKAMVLILGGICMGIGARLAGAINVGDQHSHTGWRHCIHPVALVFAEKFARRAITRFQGQTNEAGTFQRRCFVGCRLGINRLLPRNRASHAGRRQTVSGIYHCRHAPGDLSVRCIKKPQAKSTCANVHRTSPIRGIVTPVRLNARCERPALDYSSTWSPFLANQLFRSAMRFLPSSMSMILLVRSPCFISRRTNRLVCGSITVSRNCNGFISPRPLNRCVLILPLIFSDSIRSMISRRSCFYECTEMPDEQGAQ